MAQKQQKKKVKGRENHHCSIMKVCCYCAVDSLKHPQHEMEIIYEPSAIQCT